MEKYDSAIIRTSDGEFKDYPSDRYTVEHTKHLGVDVLKVTEVAKQVYGNSKPVKIPESKQNVSYFFITNITYVSYRHY